MNTNKISVNPNTVITGDAPAIIAGVLAWLVDPKSSKHCTITGGPGAGKTWMIKDLIQSFEQYQELGIADPDMDLTVTGTTHESLAIIKQDVPTASTRTIYSHLGLVPLAGKIHKRDGKKKISADYDPQMFEVNTHLKYFLCDEANYIPEEALTIIGKWFPNIKIIFVGSEHQLGTDTGPSKIFTQGWDNFYLNTGFRADNADVQATYDNSEQDVINQNPTPVFTQNPSVFYLSSADWFATMEKAYTSENAHKCITLAYTNERVFELVGIIRKFQGKAGHFNLTGPTQALRSGSPLIPKKNVELKRDSNNQTYVPIDTNSGPKRSYVGQSYKHYKYLASRAHTRRSDEVYPSLVASKEASTIHGSQGGTWDYTFLDLTNLNYLRYRDTETFRRAKHVAESRHRNKLFIKID